MNVIFKKSFLKELKKIKNDTIKEAFKSVILEVEAAPTLQKIKNLKKLSGYDSYYRIRIGDFRLGIKIEKDSVYFVVIEGVMDILEAKFEDLLSNGHLGG